MQLVDAEGLGALSIRRLGAELGVKGMSLYNHIPSKAALLYGLVDSMFAEIVLTDTTDRAWQEQMRTIMRSFRRVGLSHPNVFRLYASRAWETIFVNRTPDDRMELTRAGFSEDEARYAIRTLSGYVLGFVAREIERYGPAHEGSEEKDDFTYNTPPISPTREQDASFEFGLDVIIAGLEQVLARRQQTV